MGTQILFIVFCVIVQFCRVSGRHNFFEHYYSRYHKGHSTTTESLFPSSSDSLASSEYEQGFSQLDYNLWGKTNDMISTSDDNVLKNNKYEVTDDASLQNNMYEPTVYAFDENYNTDFSSLRIGIIIGAAVIFLSVFCCIFCCVRQFCKRNERRGFIIGSHPETAREAVPQQNALVHQPLAFQQPYPTQCYDERNQSFPPQYQPQPVQQFPPMQPQFQYSPSAMQSHNPPEAPPPYEFPHKF